MQTFNIQRVHIEQQILSGFINQQYTPILDEIEYRDMKLPFELFKANKTIRMVAKAIYNLQVEDKAIDDMSIICYIQKHTQLNEQEFLDISAKCPLSYDTMLLYMKQLKDINEMEEKKDMLRGLRR